MNLNDFEDDERLERIDFRDLAYAVSGYECVRIPHTNICRTLINNKSIPSEHAASHTTKRQFNVPLANGKPNHIYGILHSIHSTLINSIRRSAPSGASGRVARHLVVRSGFRCRPSIGHDRAGSLLCHQCTDIRAIAPTVRHHIGLFHCI